MGAYHQPELQARLFELLNSDSYRSVLADAALTALRAQEDPSTLTTLRESLQKRESQLTTGVFSRGLGILAHLARNEEKKEAVREFLTRYVNSPKKRVQLSALEGLGTLGDPQAAAVLEKFARGPKNSPVRTSAERALASVRESRKPSVELGSLRGEVLTLQKENRELRKDFDAFKKKFEAALPTEPAPAKTAVKSEPLKNPESKTNKVSKAPAFRR